MKYADLIDFEPIESVIELRDADAHEKARSLVETFVVSDRMAEQLADLVVPNLQFDRPADTKGMLIVGNYGTGKSHLMSFLSTVAEHADLAHAVKNKQVVQSLQPIIGKFKVVRSEIGSTVMSLRDFVCGELEDHLADLGVDFSFPPPEKVRNNKDALAEMMAKFHEKYHDRGLLMFVDELLDYLRTRNDQDLILDLNFLREVGESCDDLRFRFVAGLQEALFDNPRFQFVADSVRRVKARFEQLRIIREDVAFVVSERLLTKNADQQAWIREHLQQFTPLYDTMAERIEEFVRLFPVHPAYLEQFEQITVAEKREVLKTLSAEMKRLLDQEVPAKEPGLISYDSYWDHLRQDVSVRADPDVRQVIDKSNVLESRIKQAFTRKAYVPMATRICYALSVHRLTTDDIRAPIGPTPAELRDDLCLFHPELPEKSSDFLRATVETCLNEIRKTMSGQFITHNRENDQYYLDLEKDIDYEAEIEKRAESLSDSELDRYYFDALKRVLECADQTYISGYKIWEHEVQWQSHKVTRRGYLFFGAPNERSTAQPPRDFYLYFVQPFQPPRYTDGKLADEIFFCLKHPDEAFNQALRLYAGARAMAAQAGSGTRKNYEDKAVEHLRSLTGWLQDNMLTAFEVVHQGVPKKVIECLKGHRTGNMNVRELVNLVGAIYLEPCFEERYPDYPRFSVLLTKDNIRDAVEDAKRRLASGVKTQLGTAVLDGLELLDGEKLRPHQSRYAKSVLNRLEKKPAGQVLNRSDLLVQPYSKYAEVEFDTEYKLEPELLVTVLLSLVHSGDIVLKLPGATIDAASLAESAKTPIEEFCRFRHVERPKDLPLSALVALFELLGLSEGLIRDPNARDQGIKQLHQRISEITERLVVARQHAQSGLPCWGRELLSTDEREQARRQLDGFQEFLGRLQAFNSPGKLKNFPFSVDDVKEQEKSLSLLRELEATKRLVDDLNPLTQYLSAADAVLPEDDPWRQRHSELRTAWQPQLLDPAKRNEAGFRERLVKAIDDLRKEYRDHYLKLHRRRRLTVNEDKRKKQLVTDPRMERLKKLAVISLLPHGSLTELQNQLSSLKSCWELIEEHLESTAVCPHCSFRPADEPSGAPAETVLSDVDDGLDALLDGWTNSLLDNLTGDPTVQESIELLENGQKKAVRKFLKERQLPEKIGNDLVQGIQTALQGLTPVPVTPNKLISALGDGSTSCTVQDFRSRFERFVADLTKGNDESKVRIVIERDE